MGNRQIVTTESEIYMAIGLAADEIAASKDGMEKQLEIMGIASYIAARTLAHLTGEKKFSNEYIAAYKSVATAASLSPGGIASPGSVEEDK